MEIIPNHVGIIMDGNRRWAKAKGLAPFLGHQAGYKKTEEVLKWCKEVGVKILTLFAFSTENWKRSKEEVDLLMNLFFLVLTKDIKKLNKENVRVKVIGKTEDLSRKLQKAIKQAEELTKNNTVGTLNLAINYGGRQELVDAFNKIIKGQPKKITEEMISENLYTKGLADPDLIIRTSGEQRLSGFLTWQGVYSELYFVKNHWPDFSKNDFSEALNSYAERQRRFGGS
ncbi:MAG: polyprenyl diphosphate synthase [bacterium]